MAKPPADLLFYYHFSGAKKDGCARSDIAADCGSPMPKFVSSIRKPLLRPIHGVLFRLAGLAARQPYSYFSPLWPIKDFFSPEAMASVLPLCLGKLLFAGQPMDVIRTSQRRLSESERAFLTVSGDRRQKAAQRLTGAEEIERKEPPNPKKPPMKPPKTRKKPVGDPPSKRPLRRVAPAKRN